MSSKASRLAAVVATIPILALGCTKVNAGPPAAPGAPATPQQGASVTRSAFDGEKAYKLLVKQCDFGPRPVGSEAHQKTRDFLISELKKYADKVETQDFTFSGAVRRPNGTTQRVKDLPLTNIIGVINPDAKRSILLCGHWDTRPTSDQEIDPVKKMKPIMGASDGASEIAVLIELARIFHEKKPNVGVVIVFLDGEDFGDFNTDSGVFLGARHFAKNHKGYDPEYGVLLDMVGDKNLDIKREQYSQEIAPGTNAKVFSIARELGYGDRIIDTPGYNITDDHLSISQIGHIPTIDLIDFDYAPWHTQEDTPANCSGASLKVLGDVLAELIYREKAR